MYCWLTERICYIKYVKFILMNLGELQIWIFRNFSCIRSWKPTQTHRSSHDRPTMSATVFYLVEFALNNNPKLSLPNYSSALVIENKTTDSKIGVFSYNLAIIQALGEIYLILRLPFPRHRRLELSCSSYYSNYIFFSIYIIFLINRAVNNRTSQSRVRRIEKTISSTIHSPDFTFWFSIFVV